MSWLIVGDTGQLGLALTIELKKRSIPVVSDAALRIDITKPDLIDEIIERLKPSVIVNAAAWTDVDGAESNRAFAYEINAGGPKHLATVAARTGATLVQISTDYVFSGTNTEPWKVSDHNNPISVYGETKSAGEKFVLDIHPQGSYIVRTAWLYSATRKNFAKTMTRLALLGEDQVRVVNDQLGHTTFVGVLSNQIVDLVTSGSPFSTYHGTNSGQASWFEFAQEIFNLLGSDVSRVVPVSSSEFPRPAKRPAYSVLNHDEWDNTNLKPMRDWRIALSEAIPSIRLAVVEEGH